MKTNDRVMLKNDPEKRIGTLYGWNEYGQAQVEWEDLDFDDYEKEDLVSIGCQKPIIVCLCGSTRFGEAFSKYNFLETVKGKIVLSIGCNMKSDAELFKDMLDNELQLTKIKLDELHFRKIDLADEILVLDIDGYIGESTANEIRYAMNKGKKIIFLERPHLPTDHNWTLMINLYEGETR